MNYQIEDFEPYIHLADRFESDFEDVREDTALTLLEQYDIFPMQEALGWRIMPYLLNQQANLIAAEITCKIMKLCGLSVTRIGVFVVDETKLLTQAGAQPKPTAD